MGTMSSRRPCMMPEQRRTAHPPCSTNPHIPHPANVSVDGLQQICSATSDYFGAGLSLVWVLSQIRGMVEAQAVERLEQRLEELALAPTIDGKSSHAYTMSDRHRTAH